MPKHVVLEASPDPSPHEEAQADVVFYVPSDAKDEPGAEREDRHQDQSTGTK